MIGSRLGPYEILQQLGAGGMGEVYLAQDTRLGRKVAVKVLPPQFATDPERLARFEQEARAAAALNHPHIAAVFDVGAETGADGTVTRFMVQEYLQGHSLRTVIEQGRLQLARALELGTEISEALSAAHRAGIVHRDLKPENAFVTEDGHAKVLDFGLAKLTEMAATPMGSQSMSPTVLGTQAGAIMGTAGYMAPEQVEGRDVDARADVFAFGCLLYEMASGQRAFAGKSLVQTLNRIAHEEPAPLVSLDAGLPAELQRIVRKCLAKSPTRRYQTAADLTVDLLALGADVEAGRAQPGASEARVTAAPVRGAGLRVAGAAVGGLLLGAIAVAAAGWLTSSDEPAPTMRLGVVNERPHYSVSGPPLVAISADGRHVAYTTGTGLFVRDLDRLDVRAIPGTQDFNTPALSPDGQWLAFQGANDLTKVAVAGGPRTVLCEGAVRGLDWGDSDVLVLGTTNRGLRRVSSTGGDCTEITTLADGEVAHQRPELLPDGRNVLFTVWAGSLDTAQIAVAPIAGGEHRLLGVSGVYPRYVSSGHLVFARDGSLWGVRFDLGSLQVEGNPVPILDGARVETVSGSAQFDVSRDGSLLYIPGGGVSGLMEMVWVDRNGAATPVGAPTGGYFAPAISTDGKRVAVARWAEESRDIHVWDTERNRLSRVSFHDGEEASPLWSADGNELAYYASIEGGGIFARAVDGTGETRRLADAGTPWGWTTSGDLLFTRDGRPHVASPRGAAEALEAIGESRRVALSPDGRWLAFEVYTGNQPEIFVRPFPDLDGGLWQVSEEGGVEPRWSRDGRTLYFRRGGMWAADINTDPTFLPATPRLLFSLAGFALPTTSARTYDVAHDGRFLLLRSAAATAADDDADLPGIILVLNWGEELRRLIPAGR